MDDDDLFQNLTRIANTFLTPKSMTLIAYDFGG